jgi:hypothetical protein
MPLAPAVSPLPIAPVVMMPLPLRRGVGCRKANSPDQCHPAQSPSPLSDAPIGNNQPPTPQRLSQAGPRPSSHCPRGGAQLACGRLGRLSDAHLGRWPRRPARCSRAASMDEWERDAGLRDHVRRHPGGGQRGGAHPHAEGSQGLGGRVVRVVCRFVPRYQIATHGAWLAPAGLASGHC